MKLNRSDCIILPLVLKRKWYDMIASGKKWQEYRESPTVCRMIERLVGKWYIENGAKKLVVTFYLGYQKDRPSMSYMVDYVTHENIRFHPEWGEPKGFHYVIDIGDRVELVSNESEVKG